MNIRSQNPAKTPFEANGTPTPLVTLIGDIGIDMVMGPLNHWPEVGTETLLPQSEMRAGGSAGNTALALRHIGANVRLVSSIGNDALGQWLKGQFEGIALELALVPAPTSVSVGLLHTGGERNFFTTTGHLAVQDMQPFLHTLPPATGGAIVLLTGAFLTPVLRAQYVPLLKHLQMLGYSVAIDTGWPSEGWTPFVIAEVRSWLELADHVLLNDLEITRIAQTDDLDVAMALLSSWMPSDARLIAKIGPDGAIGWQNMQKERASPPLVADIFDTVGAGDAFNAGYLQACAQGANLPSALDAGCRTATDIISHFPRQLRRDTAWQTGG
jgi:ribokinase